MNPLASPPAFDVAPPGRRAPGPARRPLAVHRRAGGGLPRDRRGDPAPADARGPQRDRRCPGPAAEEPRGPGGLPRRRGDLLRLRGRGDRDHRLPGDRRLRPGSGSPGWR